LNWGFAGLYLANREFEMAVTQPKEWIAPIFKLTLWFSVEWKSNGQDINFGDVALSERRMNNKATCEKTIQSQIQIYEFFTKV